MVEFWPLSDNSTQLKGKIDAELKKKTINDESLNYFLKFNNYPYLSLFLVSKFLSMPSIRFSNHCAIAACLSGGWLLMMLSLIWLKYSSLSKMRPSRGLDIDHWFLQSSNIITFKTVLRICCRISGCISRTLRNISLLCAMPTRCSLPGYTENEH